MDKYERAAALIKLQQTQTRETILLCFDEAVQQILYDLRTYCKLMSVSFEDCIGKSHTPFVGLGQ